MRAGMWPVRMPGAGLVLDSESLVNELRALVVEGHGANSGLDR
jgi:hypothetical protein